jgi:hypothetical protein
MLKWMRRNKDAPAAILGGGDFVRHQPLNRHPISIKNTAKRYFDCT